MYRVASSIPNDHMRCVPGGRPPGSRPWHLLARLRFSTYTLTENRIRPFTDHELQTTVSVFLDLRPDGYAIHLKSKRLAILELGTRAMDYSEDWEEKKDA